MVVEQRDVFLLPHPFDSRVEEHPFIALSIQEANNYENTFIAVMITSSTKYRDDFSFELTDDMFEKPLRKSDCHARMHLLTLCLNEEIKGVKINRMKPFYFKQLMKSIGSAVFNFEFSPVENHNAA